MAEARERYRKLPGRRRGFIKGSSVWMGSDHLLLVHSTRFREDYKRFHLRDIQAVVVARAPRFALSTRAAAIAVLWLIVYLFAAASRRDWAPVVVWTAAACLVGAWVYVCAAQSCACRIYTAVSRDDLPSVYRTWIARRFLAELEPAIGQVQGVLEGNWAEAVEDRTVGPAAAAGAPGGGIAGVTGSRARSRTPASDVFLASLFASAALNIATLHSLTRTLQWVWYGLVFLQIVGAIGIFWQHHRGILRAGMQKLAVAALVAMGIVYYARTAIASVLSASNQLFPDLTALSSLPGYVLLREVDAGVCVVLGLVGVALMARGES